MKLSILNSDGKEGILTVIEPGNWIGEVALLDNTQRRAHNAIALQECELAAVSARAFEALMQDPDFARQLHESGTDPLPSREAPGVPPDGEARALRQTKQKLHGWDLISFWLFNMAVLFSCLAFGRIISDTSWDVSPRNFIITVCIAGVFWLAVLVRPLWVRRKVYRQTMGPDR